MRFRLSCVLLYFAALFSLVCSKNFIEKFEDAIVHVMSGRSNDKTRNDFENKNSTDHSNIDGSGKTRRLEVEPEAGSPDGQRRVRRANRGFVKTTAANDSSPGLPIRASGGLVKTTAEVDQSKSPAKMSERGFVKTTLAETEDKALKNEDENATSWRERKRAKKAANLAEPEEQVEEDDSKTVSDWRSARKARKEANEQKIAGEKNTVSETEAAKGKNIVPLPASSKVKATIEPTKEEQIKEDKKVSNWRNARKARKEENEEKIAGEKNTVSETEVTKGKNIAQVAVSSKGKTTIEPTPVELPKKHLKRENINEAKVEKPIEPTVLTPKTSISRCNRSLLSDWTYNTMCSIEGNSQASPNKWSQIYSNCSGNDQSPININTSKVSSACKTELVGKFYQDNIGTCGFSDLTFETSVKGWEVLFDEKRCGVLPSMLIAGNKHTLQKFMFHLKSEHSINGLYGNAELQMVFIDSTNLTEPVHVAIILMVDSSIDGYTDIDDYWGRLSYISKRRDKKKIKFDREVRGQEKLADPFKFIPKSETYFTYMGSKTVPPCTEHVRWIVMPTYIYISALDLESLKDSMISQNGSILDVNGSSARPAQKLNTRTVQMCTF